MYERVCVKFWEFLCGLSERERETQCERERKNIQVSLFRFSGSLHKLKEKFCGQVANSEDSGMSSVILLGMSQEDGRPSDHP
jgi:hypothetical protein